MYTTLQCTELVCTYATVDWSCCKIAEQYSAVQHSTLEWCLLVYSTSRQCTKLLYMSEYIRGSLQYWACIRLVGYPCAQAFPFPCEAIMLRTMAVRHTTVRAGLAFNLGASTKLLDTGPCDGERVQFWGRTSQGLMQKGAKHYHNHCQQSHLHFCLL